MKRIRVRAFAGKRSGLEAPATIGAFLLLVVGSLGAVAAPQVSGVDFSRDIRPILADRCFPCHGPDAKQRKADLRLDLEDEAKHSVILPGNAESSKIIARILSQDPEERMPPDEAGKPPLTGEEVALFQRWIDEGAVWQQHWAYVAPVKPEPPEVGNQAWVRNEIDQFVLQRLQDAGLSPSAPESRETLLRRVTLDLTGLPPALQEMDAFLADNSPQAYERVVDRLLASEAYGEKMAVDWLDGARYADTNGYQNDFAREMWPWRDWVVHSFNNNMPFDQFVIEQIAGDLLPEPTQSQLIATGFNRNNHSVTEAGSIEEEWLLENLVDRVETTSTVFLGLSMGCARCHDHKYDPISQKEFYKFYAFFNSTEDKGFYSETRGNTGPTVSLPTPENQKWLDEFDGKIASAEAALREEQDQAEARRAAWMESLKEGEVSLPPAPERFASLKGSLAGSEGSSSALAGTFVGGGEPVWASGLLGPALLLDGSDATYLNLGQAIQFEKDAEFSLSLWVKPEAPGALLSKMDDQAGYRGFDILINENGELQVHLVHHWDDNAILVTSDKRMEWGVWTHVCVTYRGNAKAGDLRIFTNGYPATLRTDKDKLTESIATEAPLRLGARSTSLFLKGAVTDFRYFSEALSETEVRNLADATLKIAQAEGRLGGQSEALEAYAKLSQSYGIREKEATLAELNKKKVDYIQNSVPSVMIMRELPEPRLTYLLRRGQYTAPDTSEVLQPAVPAFLPSFPEGVPRNRMGLAKWLVDPGNPLVARVTVNRIWQSIFGQGFVNTPDNLGLQSEAPSHQELLDWLAVTFRETGWDLKALQKRIVMSATYQQDSALNEVLLARDPENRLLARGPRFRMSAEVLRDNALAVSGLLVKKLGGAPVKPYQPQGLWEELAGGASQGPYVPSEGEDLYRRSLYTIRKRTVSPPSLSTFDAPSWEFCRVKRGRTNTPLQALALLNDETYVEAARHLAGRMLHEAGPQVRERVKHGFRLATGRLPTTKEEDLLLGGLSGYMAVYNQDPDSAEAFLAHGASKRAEEEDPTRLAAFTALASVILNLDECITKE